MEVTGTLKLQGYQKVENQMKLGKRFRTLWVNNQRSTEFNPVFEF
jgi:hypothetical protein